MFYIFAVSSLSTLLVNGNPLIRYDGYYILCDLLNIENLMGNSADCLKRYWRYYFFGLGEKPSEPLAAPMVRRTKSSDLYLWLLAGACAVLLALSVGLMVSSRRARRAKKERAAARRQRVRENLNRPRRREPTSGQEK